MTLKVTADEASGTSDIDLAVASLGMLQKQIITVRATIRAEFKGVNGGVQFQGAAARQDFQSAYNHVKKGIAGASKVAGEVTLIFKFTPPLDVTDDQFNQIHTVVKNLGMKNTTMTAEVTK
jgi:hypothetical protein